MHLNKSRTSAELGTGGSDSPINKVTFSKTAAFLHSFKDFIYKSPWSSSLALALA